MSGEKMRYRFLQAIRTVFDQEAVFIVRLFILNFVTMAWMLARQEKWDVLVCYGFSVFFASFSVAALLQMFINEQLRRLLKGLFISISLVVFVIEFFSMYNYHVLIGAGIVNSILQTNSSETIEFLEMYVGWQLAAEVIIGGAAVLYLTQKLSLGKLRESRKIKLGVALVTIGFAYTLMAAFMYYDFFVERYFPVQRAYASTQMALKNIEAYRNLSTKLNEDIELTQNDSQIKNVVFILGESANRNHMGLYGYYLSNTPNLQRMSDEEEIIVFDDVVSPHSTTIAVLSKLFTFCNHEADKEWYEYTNLIDIMNAAGYKTFWLSNQESSGVWGNVAQLFASKSRYHEFTRIRESREDYGILDETLFPVIDKALQNREEKNFFVIHLMGSHGLYYNRYPSKYSKYTARDIELPVTEKEKDIVAQYDNSMYYNDHIIKEIIKKFSNDETLIIYASDHGESVYDESDVAGHIEENPSKNMIEIPMLVWASEEFKENFPEKLEQLENARHRPYMTDDFIHTILELVDVKTSDFRPERSIINEGFDAQRPRIFSNKDYDKEIRCTN